MAEAEAALCTDVDPVAGLAAATAIAAVDLVEGATETRGEGSEGERKDDEEGGQGKEGVGGATRPQ